MRPPHVAQKEQCYPCRAQAGARRPLRQHGRRCRRCRVCFGATSRAVPCCLPSRRADGYEATRRLEEIEELTDGREPFRPVRHHFGITSFGVNAWTAPQVEGQATSAGPVLIPPDT